MTAIEIPIKIEYPVPISNMFRKMRKTITREAKSAMSRAILLLFINLIFLV